MYILFVFLSLIISSCSEKQNFEKYFNNYDSSQDFPMQDKLKIIPLNDMTYNIPPLNLCIINDKYLIYSTIGNNLSNVLYSIDTNCPDSVMGFGNKGKGPGEFISISSVISEYSDTNSFIVFDVSLQRLTYYSLNNVRINTYLPDSTTKLNNDFGYAEKIYPFNSSFYLATGLYDPYRIAVYDKNFEFHSNNLKINESLSNIEPSKLKNTFLIADIEFSSQENKLFVCYKWIDIIQILDYNFNEIISVHTPDKIDLFSDIKKNNLRFAYFSSSSYNGKIYSSYSGEKFQNNNWLVSFGRYINVFDWTGSPNKQIELNYRFGDMVLSKKLGKMYMIYYDGEYFRIGYVDLIEDRI